LGAAYQPGDAPFGEAPPSDIQFTYSTPDGGSLVGVVEYLGEGIANNLVLNIDPATGAAQLLNESIYTIDFDGFAITSDAGSLDGQWTRDESELSEDWVLSNPSDANIALLNPDFADTLQGGEIINLGTLFSGDDSQQSQDLVMAFVLAEENFERFGVVRYNGVIQHSGDFNADGAVDGADFVLWQQQFGQEGQLEADGNGDGRVDQSDLAIWENQYGIVSQTSQPTSEVVPEPSAWLLALVCVAAAKLGCAAFRDRVAVC
jgi:hypothetical protein